MYGEREISRSIHSIRTLVREGEGRGWEILEHVMPAMYRVTPSLSSAFKDHPTLQSSSSLQVSGVPSLGTLGSLRIPPQSSTPPQPLRVVPEKK